MSRWPASPDVSSGCGRYPSERQLDRRLQGCQLGLTAPAARPYGYADFGRVFIVPRHYDI